MRFGLTESELKFVDEAVVQILKQHKARKLTHLEDSNFAYKVDLVRDSELASSYREQVNREKIEL